MNDVTRVMVATAWFASVLGSLQIQGAQGHPQEAGVKTRNESTEPRPIPKLSDLRMPGSGGQHESFARVIAGVAQLLGRETDYEAVYSMSGAAFAPGIDPEMESCPGRWVRRGSELSMPVIGRALGLRFERLDIPPMPKWQGDWEKTNAAWAEQVHQAAPVLKQALDNGAVVVTRGGWKWDPPIHTGVYYYWGVITDVRDNGSVVGMHPFSDRRDAPMHWIDSCWTVYADDVTLTEEELDHTVLKLAMDRLHSRGAFADNRRLFGLAALDRIIAQFSEVPFCGDDCGPRARGCPITNAKMIHEGSTVASQWLEARGYQVAAKRYARAAKLLDPFLKWTTGYEPIMGDREKQIAHASDVLTRVRRQIALAGNVLVPLLVEPTVKREGSKVWIDGVPAAEGGGNGYIRGMQTMFDMAGTRVPYSRLMGLSGMAFITQAMPEHRWEGKLDVGWWPLDTFGWRMRRDFLGQAVGHELIESRPGKADAATRSSIDAGLPALVTCHFGFLITGYDNATEEAPMFGRCGAQADTNTRRLEGTKQEWDGLGVLTVGKKLESMNSDAADLAALRHAVRLIRSQAEIDPHQDYGGCVTGQKAFQAWSGLLRNADEPTEDRHHANMKYRLIEQRTQAVTYLRDVAKRQDEAADLLEHAAKTYERVIEQLSDIKEKGLEQDMNHRQRLADQVDAIAKLEQAAADFLEKAVEAMSILPAVKREGDRVWIEGVPRPGGSVSSLATLAAALQQRGELVDYNYLMGVSGRAFRFQMGWCGSSPHAYIGYNCLTPALEAMGYEHIELAGVYDVTVEPAKKATVEQQEETRKVVKAEIDDGRTVMFNSEEDALLVGYEPVSDDNPTGWLRRPGPHGGGKLYMRPIKNMPWGLSALKKVSDPVPQREAAINAIRVAVINAERGVVEGSEMRTGFAAWRKWIRELQPKRFKAVVEQTRHDLKAHGRENENALWGICNGNAWIYQNLREARREAGAYLRRIAPELPESARPHLLAAADAYKRVADVLENKGAKEGDPCPYDYVPYAFRLKNVEEWTDEHRALQEKTLRAALPHERAAVDALEAALRVLNVEVTIPMPPLPAVTLKREGRRVWLDGALELFKRFEELEPPALFTRWAQRGDSWCYLLRMRIAGYDVDYATLNTVSGHGPSFSYCGAHEGNDYINYLPPDGRDKRLARATGCKLVWRRHQDIENYWQALKKAIDAGEAVQAPNEEDILFFGYVDADDPVDRKVLPAPMLFVDDEEWTWAQFEKWFGKRMVNGWMGTIEGPVEPADPRESAIEVMQLMVDLANGKDSRRKPDDNIHWGIDGIEAYAKDLADMSKSGADGRAGHFGGGWRGCHCVYPQAGGRPAAARYLRNIAPQFDGSVREHIESAAVAYDRATDAWAVYFTQLGRDDDRTVGLEHTQAWTTAEMRQAGAAAVAEAAKYEQDAISKIEKALTIVEKKESER